MKPSCLKWILTGTALCLMNACTKDFEAINANPNAPESINPEFIMSDVILNTAYGYQQNAYYDKPASAGRYITLVRNEGNDKFSWDPEGWSGIYNRLSNNKNLYDLAKEKNFTHYMAISMILNSFNFAFLTDLWGDIPYSEALLSKEKGIVHPKYDMQQDIYPAIMEELKKANTMLASPGEAVDENSDVLYNGDLMKWRKLANSLRLRMLLRASKNLPTAFADMQAIINNPTDFPVFEGNEDNAAVKYLGDTGANSWPGGDLANSFSEFDKRKPSKELVDKLLERNDPRLKVWVAPVENKDGALVDFHDYVGAPNAFPAPYDYNGGNDNISKLGTIFNENANPLVKATLMNYTELNFILAEVVQQGKVSVPNETAESLYYKGIKASMEQYEVADAADASGYYDQALVKYNGTLEQLINQKWLGLFITGAEGWFDHRRTGFPQFVTGPVAAQNTIPVRYIYPDEERATNNERYKAAIAIQGTDNINTKLWYLK